MNFHHFHIIGDETDRRVQSFQNEAHRFGHRTSLTSYQEIIETAFENRSFIIPSGQILRLESPGENATLNGALRRLGGTELTFEKGEVRAQKEWFSGFSKALNAIVAERAFIPPNDVLEMFDKVKMTQHLKKAECVTPERLPQETTLKTLKNNNQANRVFIKARFGSSASGVLACSIKGQFVKCTTSLEVDGNRFFNSLRIRTYVGDIAEKCINFILSEGAVIEKWMPKPTLKNGAFDLRIVCIKGKASHSVVRISKSPMTNLHLGNQRGTLEEVSNRFGSEAIHLLKTTAESAAQAFPKSHYLGVDLSLNTAGTKAVVFEVNAFGDLIPGILHNGQSTYAAEITSFPPKS